MKRIVPIITSAATLLLTCTIAFGTEGPPVQPRTVWETHPRLAMAILTFAKVAELPKDVVLRSEAGEFRTADLNAIIEAQPEPVREDLRKNAYLVLNQRATQAVLLHLAKAAMPLDTGTQNNDIIQSYLEKNVLSKVEVTDAEVRELYESEKSMFGGATYEQMLPDIKRYLLDQKKQQAVTDYIRDLGKSVNIEVSSSWIREQAVSARDNPVDKVRDSGKPSLVDLGAVGCSACDMMDPILRTLEKKYQGKLNVLFINVRERQVLAAKYSVQTIPVQVFFDKDGNEVFRHTGFWAQAEIEKKLTEMGVTQ